MIGRRPGRKRDALRPQVEGEPQERGAGGSEPLQRDEIRRRAVRGGIVLAGRDVILRGVGLVGFFTLARLLSPRDLGLLALGLGLVFFTQFLADGGMGAALMRAPERPSRAVLRSVLWLQLTIAVVVSLVTLAVSVLIIGGDAVVVTVIQVAAVPILVFRVPGALLLERELRYGEVAATEVAEVLVYNVAAVGLVLAGAGVIGVAVAAILKSVAGVLIVWHLEPDGRVAPSRDMSSVRPLMSFGVKYQAGQLTNITRDQGTNFGIAAIGGLQVLGVYSLSSRLLSVPILAFDSVVRVSFPAMARLIEVGDDPRRAVTVAASFASLVIGFIVTLLGAATLTLLPVMLGGAWSDVSNIVVLACAGTALAGPISIASVGYLMAVGDVGVVLKASLAQLVAALGLGLGLLPLLGATGLGIGLLSAYVVDVLVLSQALRRRLGLNALKLAAAGTGAYVVAIAAGLALDEALPSDLVGGVLVVLGAGAAYCAAMVVLIDVRGLLVVVRRAAGARSAPVTAEVSG